jgi:hypothetical protein
MDKKDNNGNGISRHPLLEFTIGALAFGAEHLELLIVQQILRTLNYLMGEFHPGQLDEPTRVALKKFQLAQHLEPTGTTDENTLTALKQPRCGNPYLLGRPIRSRGIALAGAPDDIKNSIKIGCDFQGVATLTYKIGEQLNELPNPHNGLSLDDIKTTIQKAFDAWSIAIPVDFNLAEGNRSATFNIKWAEKAHDGDGQPFDDIGLLYAHAFYPKKCGGNFAGQCHFDRGNSWSLNGATNTFDLQTVAMHEIGHLLGLADLNHTNSIMREGYRGPHRKIDSEDPAFIAIQDIYGERK